MSNNKHIVVIDAETYECGKCIKTEGKYVSNVIFNMDDLDAQIFKAIEIEYSKKKKDAMLMTFMEAYFVYRSIPLTYENRYFDKNNMKIIEIKDND